MTTKTALAQEIADLLTEVRLHVSLAKMTTNRWPAGAPGKKGGQFAPKAVAGGSFKAPQLGFGFPFGPGGPMMGSKDQPGPNAKPHPKIGEDGKPVRINYPSIPSGKATWTDPKQTATFTPGGSTPEALNGVALKPWKAPTTLQGWAQVKGQMPELDRDLPFTPTQGKSVGSGVLILEPDGRVWLTKPTNEFGGYKHTYPKGTAEPGLSLQANAIKEAFEETGLKVRITGVLGDVERDTSKARYYIAVREGGTPKEMGWETQAMRLAPRSSLKSLLNKPHDQQLVDRLVAMERLKKIRQVMKAAKPPAAGKAAWASQPRWEAGTPIGGQWKSYDAAGLPLPPKVGSATNPKWQKAVQAAYDAAAKGDNGPAFALASSTSAKLAEFNVKQGGGEAINSQLKWAAGAGFYATQLMAAKQTSVKAEATATKLSGPDKLSKTFGQMVAPKPGGSNPGAIYSDGEDQYLVKGNAKLVQGAVTQQQSDDRAKNEILAAKLMQAAGVGAPDMKLVDLEGQHGGGLGVASKMVDGLTPFNKNNAAHLAAAQADFAVHAWLGNYDVVGMSFDNLVMKDGKAINIDPGGAILFRAQGLPKDSFGTSVGELNTLRDPKINAQAAAVFGSMKHAQIKESAKKLAGMTDDVIDKLVDAHGPGDAKAKAELATTLKKRRDYIFGYAGLNAKGEEDAPPPPPAVKASGGALGVKSPTYVGNSKDTFTKHTETLNKLAATGTLDDLKAVVIDIGYGKTKFVFPNGDALQLPNSPKSDDGKAFLAHYGNLIAAKMQEAPPAPAASFDPTQVTVKAAKLTFKEGKSDKFWQVAAVGSVVVTQWGKTGTTGQQTFKDMGSASAAQKEANKLASAKLGKGYQNAGQVDMTATLPAKFATSGTTAPPKPAGGVQKPTFAGDPSSVKVYEQLSTTLLQLAAVKNAEEFAALKQSMGNSYTIKVDGKFVNGHVLKDGPNNQAFNAYFESILWSKQKNEAAKAASSAAQPTPAAAAAKAAGAAASPPLALPAKPTNIATPANPNKAILAKVDAIEKTAQAFVAGTLGKDAALASIQAHKFSGNSQGAKGAKYQASVLAAIAGATGDVKPAMPAAAPAAAPAAGKPKTKPKLDPSKLTPPPDFMNWSAPGKPGPSSVAAVNQANAAAVAKIWELAQKGDVDAIKKLTLPVLDKASGQVTGSSTPDKHPSQHVSGFASQVLAEIDNQLNPPKQFRIGSDHPLSALNKSYPVPKGTSTGAPVTKVGKFLVLGSPGVVDQAALGLPEKQTMKNGKLGLSTYAKAAQQSWTAMPASQQQALVSFWGSGYSSMNKSMWTGNPSAAAKAAGSALLTHGHEIKAGTVLSRKIGVSGQDLLDITGATGKVLMEPGIMSTSISPDAWSGNVHLKMTVGPGVKGLYADKGSAPGGGALSPNAGSNEREITLPPNTRLLVQKVTKTNKGADADGFGGSSQYIVEVLVLPSQ